MKVLQSTEDLKIRKALKLLCLPSIPLLINNYHSFIDVYKQEKQIEFFEYYSVTFQLFIYLFHFCFNELGWCRKR